MSSPQPTRANREVARRAFAREFNDASHTFTESDEDRAPVYALLPTGAAANRVFLVGTLTETQDVGSDAEYWQGRVVDPTGTFFVYAGEYQPESAGVLRSLEPPAYVAVVGKPRTYETDDGGVNVSIRPESITVVDAHTRDRWVVETAERTAERIAAFDASDGYGGMASDAYGEVDLDAYREAAIEAVESLDEDAGGPGESASDGSGTGSEGTDQ